MTARAALERAVATLDLAAVAAARWFGGKGREPVAAALVDALEVPGADGGMLVLADLRYADCGTERYLLPARVRGGALEEAAPGDALWPALAVLVAGGGEHPGVESGRFQAVTGALEVGPAGAGRVLTADQSNTSVVLAERLVVKCFRRPALGIHPEPELLAGLTRVGSRRAPAFGGSLVRRSAEGEEALTCLYAFVPGEPVGWESLIERLRAALASADRNLLAGLAAEAGGLGSAVAELHVDLAAAFGTASARVEDADAARAQAQQQLAEALAVATPDLERALRPRAAEVAAALGDLGRLAGSPLTRTHGDLHVAQLVASPGGSVVVDFEGEPGRPLGERRQLRSPLRDLACLLLSFDHVAAAAGRRLAPTSATDPDAWADAAFAWSSEARRRAGEAYRAGIEGSELRFDERLLRALELEKECHEVIYAATVLPEWSYAPRLTIARLLDGQARE